MELNLENLRSAVNFLGKGMGAFGRRKVWGGRAVSPAVCLAKSCRTKSPQKSDFFCLLARGWAGDVGA